MRSVGWHGSLVETMCPLTHWNPLPVRLEQSFQSHLLRGKFKQILTFFDVNLTPTRSQCERYEIGIETAVSVWTSFQGCGYVVLRRIDLLLKIFCWWISCVPHMWRGVAWLITFDEQALPLNFFRSSLWQIVKNSICLDVACIERAFRAVEQNGPEINANSMASPYLLSEQMELYSLQNDVIWQNEMTSHCQMTLFRKGNFHLCHIALLQIVTDPNWQRYFQYAGCLDCWLISWSSDS